MPFVALGVEHKTAPLTIRERVALDAVAVTEVSKALSTHPAIAECVILSTCNRTEAYLFSEQPDQAVAAAVSRLIPPPVQPYLHRWEEQEAIEHLFRVAAGLEAQVLGEGQIMSQVREALETAQRAGSIGPNLHALFRFALRCAKHTRADSDLGRLNPSVADQAVALAEHALGDLAGRTVLLIGGGTISRLLAEQLSHRQLTTLYVANRTRSVALELAQRFNGRPILLSDIPQIIPEIDLIVSATSAPRPVLQAAHVAPRHKPLHIVDLALPRDVDPAVRDRANVFLHDLDHLLPGNHPWEATVAAIEETIRAEVQEFTAWYLTRQVVPVIANLRSHVEAVQRAELERVAPQLKDLTEREHAAVEALTGRLIDKMFHHLVVRLRLAAQTDPQLVEAAKFFFLHGEGSLFPHAEYDGISDDSEVRA